MKLRECLDWLNQRPDAHGDCDRCHKDPVGLWSLPDELETEPEAGWMYCHDCFLMLCAERARSR
jgi:hypothetical protein